LALFLIPNYYRAWILIFLVQFLKAEISQAFSLCANLNPHSSSFFAQQSSAADFCIPQSPAKNFSFGQNHKYLRLILPEHPQIFSDSFRDHPNFWPVPCQSSKL
jgi:hypothetical protein